MKTITQIDELEKLAYETGLRHDELQAEFDVRQIKSAVQKRVKPVGLVMTEENLLPFWKLEMELFSERHINDRDPDGMPFDITLSDVEKAYQELRLIGKPWPSRYEAEEQMARIQAQLDLQIIP